MYGSCLVVPEVKLADPLMFWFQQELSGDYVTTLPLVAQDLMAVQSTSICSERMFSISGILSQNRSSHISPKLLEARVLLKANKVL